MNIQPNWTVTSQGPWQLIYNDSFLIALIQASGLVSTEAKVFAGTRAECEAEIERLGLPWVSEEARKIGLALPEIEQLEEPIYRLIYNENNSTVLFLGPKTNEVNQYQGTEFLGTKMDCEAQIVLLNLSVSDNSEICN